MPKKPVKVKKRPTKPKARPAPAVPAVKPSHQVFPVALERKAALLVKLVRSGGVLPSLIFANSGPSLEELGKIFEKGGGKAEPMESFKEHAVEFPLERVPFLLGTDADAKKLKVKGARRVFNWDLPASLKDYELRMASLAGLETPGAVMTLCTPEEQAVFDAYVRDLDAKVEVVILREFAPRSLRPEKPVAAPTPTPVATVPMPEAPVSLPTQNSALNHAIAGGEDSATAGSTQYFQGIPPLPARAPALDLRPLDDAGPSPSQPQAQKQQHRHPAPQPHHQSQRNQPVAPAEPAKPQQQKQRPHDRNFKGRNKPTGPRPPQVQPQVQVQAPAHQAPKTHSEGQREPRGARRGREERPVSDVKDILRRAANQKAYVTGKSSDLRPKKDHGKYGTTW